MRPIKVWGDRDWTVTAVSTEKLTAVEKALRELNSEAAITKGPDENLGSTVVKIEHHGRIVDIPVTAKITDVYEVNRGAGREDVREAMRAIGERFNYTVTDENWADIVNAAEQELPRLIAARPVVPLTKPRTPEEETAHQAELAAQKAKQLEKRKIVEANHAQLRALAPAWARAVIIAALEQDECDEMGDYYSVSTQRVVALAWSKHTRNLFPELRKAAARFAETAHLATPGPLENRWATRPKDEKRSDSYYLKVGGTYDSGWAVRKIELSNLPSYEIDLSLLAVLH